MVVILDVEKHLQVDDPPIYEELDYSEAEPLQPPTFISPKKRHNRRRKLSRRARVWLRLGFVVFLLIFIRAVILRRNEKDFEFLQRIIEEHPIGNDLNGFSCLSQALNHNKTEKLFLYVFLIPVHLCPCL